jgi:hypothetical protein
MKCKKHGDLDVTKIIRSGKNKNGTQRYKCKACMKELHAEHYRKNKEKVNAAHEAYKAKDPEKYREAKNRSKRENHWKYKEKNAARSKKYEAERPWLKIARQKRHKDKLVSNLSDQYIRQNLVRGTSLRQADIPQDLVTVKKIILQIKRKLKEKIRCQKLET